MLSEAQMIRLAEAMRAICGEPGEVPADWRPIAEAVAHRAGLWRRTPTGEPKP